MNFFGSSHSNIASKRRESKTLAAAASVHYGVAVLLLRSVFRLARRGSDVGELLNPPPGLAMLNSYQKQGELASLSEQSSCRREADLNCLRFAMGPST